MSSTDLVPRDTPLMTRPSIVNPDEWAMLAQIANTISNTEFVPRGLRGNKAATMACLLYGREQGIGPMTALKEVSMVDGSPTMSAALMAAKIRAAGHSLQRREQRDDTGKLVATSAVGKRGDNGDEDTFTFSLEMAARAGLANKNNWKQYPEAMMWARAVSQLARTLFSDVFIGSVYTAEELGAAETDESGQVIDGVVVGADQEGEADANLVTTDAAASPGSESDDVPSGLRSPVEESATGPQKKKLNVLYGQLTKKPNEHRKDAIVGSAGGMQGEDWATVRERLTKGEAHDLIDRLEKFEANEKLRAAAEAEADQQDLPF